MKVENGTITEATNEELYEYWLKRYDDIMPYTDFKRSCEENGTVVKNVKEELLPCPFCGGKPHLEKKHRAIIQGKKTRVTYVRCTECGARQGWIDVRDYGCTSSSSEAIRKAVERWNQ